MMKFILLALFAVAAVQATPRAALRSPKDLTDDVTAAIEELRVLIAEAKVVAQADLDAAVAEVQAYAVDLEAATDAEMRTMVDEAINSVQGPVDIVLNCIEQSGIKTVPDKLMDELRSCLTAKVAEALAIALDTMAQINAAEQLVVTFEARLIECDGDFFCLAELLLEVGDAAVDIPSKIYADVQAAVDLIRTLPADMEACALEKLNRAAIAIAVALQSIQTCIENALGH